MKVRQVAGENIVIMPGNQGTDMTKVVAFNESALHLYNTLGGKDFTLQDAVDALMEHYEVDAGTARRDAEAWIGEMRQNSLIFD